MLNRFFKHRIKPTATLPDFIIPGFQKCATTALWKNLNQHPRICMATCPTCPGGKELNFFSPWRKNTNFNRGFGWYSSHFKDDGRLWGEASPSYTGIPEKSAAMIRKALPEVKLIFSMRNPVDRAYSALNHYRQIYPESKDWGVWFPDKSLLYN